jgi:hypothetical protein
MRLRQIAITAATACIAWAGVVAAQLSGEGGNLPLPPLEIEQRMAEAPFTITKVDAAGGGVMGAKKLHIAFTDGASIEVKWKASSAGGEGWNNTPRFEIAAYQVQKLYLEPADYIVPPVMARCIAFDTYAPVNPHPKATFEGTHCVFGTLSAWLQNVRMPSSVFDAHRFSTDQRYAYHFANLNLLTYLINHRDGRLSNFLISDDDANPQTFSVDNGIAFDGLVYNFLSRSYDHLVVAGLPRQSVERLRQLTDQDWQRLAVLVQMHVDPQGILQPVPFTPVINADEGIHWVDGTLQMGLTTAEINEVKRRAAALLLEVDRGTMVLF